jgi:hypothetical protein
MGTALILAPIAADYLFQHNVALLLAQAPGAAASLTTQLSGWYRAVCWLTGSVMIGLSFLCELAQTRQDSLTGQEQADGKLADLEQEQDD